MFMYDPALSPPCPISFYVAFCAWFLTACFHQERKSRQFGAKQHYCSELRTTKTIRK